MQQDRIQAVLAFEIETTRNQRECYKMSLSILNRGERTHSESSIEGLNKSGDKESEFH